MKNRVLNTIKKYNLIQNGDVIVLGVSGGPDSISMLYILNEIRKEKIIDFEIIVAHINHMIREEADDDEKFVLDFCKKIGVQAFFKKIDVQKQAMYRKTGTEEEGRRVRYEFFEEIAQKVNANKIGIAHNKNDKVETMILNLLRGSGVSGLKGIEPIRDNKFIRPLIECERFEIEKYCEEKGLEPKIDKTNFENIYNRNKVRNIILPYIKKEFNPNIIETMNRLSELVSDENRYINEMTEKEYNKMVIQTSENEIILDLKKFNNQDKVIKSRLILYTITKLKGSSSGIEKIHIEDIIKLCENNIGNKFLVPNKNLKILIKNKKIFFALKQDNP